MPFDPDIHHRRSIRLKEYDYSQNGAYFVTFCTQNREKIFGEILNGEMRLNRAGEMIWEMWKKLPEKFPQIFLDEFVVMPNHFHGIIVIDDESDGADHVGADSVGADPCVCPSNQGTNIGAFGIQGAHAGAPLRKPTVSTIIQWFKTMTTNAYIRGVKSGVFPEFAGKIWQRNFYERIIRNEKEWEAALYYIQENPRNWESDENYG